MKVSGPLVLVFAIAASPVAAQSPEPAGRVKVVSGPAFIVHERHRIPATVGDPVFEADRLTTGPDGGIGVTLRDDTLIALGPDSEIELTRFDYSPAQGRFAFVLEITRGLLAYASGRIAKLRPESARLETPSAIVGVRGTRLAVRVKP
jgi:hypothetical protein